MINWLLTASFCVLSVQTAITAVFLCKVAAIFREILLFISPAGENQPSPAAVLWSSMSKLLVQEFKVSMMGLMSVQSRAEKRVENELIEQAISSKSPLASAALNSFPSLKKLFLRNPGLVDYAISKIAGASGPKDNGGSESESFSARLGRYA